jgi:hypothetical protein
MGVLFREEMDQAGCEVPGCSHEQHSVLYLHSLCHPSAGTRAFYRRGTGLLELQCRVCRREVATVVVAAEHPAASEAAAPPV